MSDWEWFGHFSVRIRWAFGVLYVDPFQLREKRAEPADLILLTNPRVGHFSPEDIEIVRKDGGLVAGPEDCVAGLPGPTQILTPGDVLRVQGLEVRTVPAYSVGKSFYPFERRWAGYLIQAGARTYYHAGATDRIPEMADLRAEVAFLPVSGRYLMDAEAAAGAAAIVGAKTRVATFLAGDRYFDVPGFVTKSEPGSPRS